LANVKHIWEIPETEISNHIIVNVFWVSLKLQIVLCTQNVVNS